MPQVGAVTVGYVAAPVPFVSSPLLAGGDATDEVTAAFFVAAALEEKKDEEEKARVRRQREAAEHEARMQELSPAESRAWMRWAGHLPPKKRKKRTPRTSSHSSHGRACRRLLLFSWPSSTAAVACLRRWFSWFRSSSRCVPFGFWQARDAQHHGRYGPEGLLQVRRHPFRAAEADPHGPDRSADH